MLPRLPGCYRSPPRANVDDIDSERKTEYAVGGFETAVLKVLSTSNLEPKNPDQNLFSENGKLDGRIRDSTRIITPTPSNLSCCTSSGSPVLLACDPYLNIEPRFRVLSLL